MARPPEAPPESAMLQAFTGLKNTVTEERLGPGELSIAKNIDLDDAGQIHRRRGYRLVDASNHHSLFTTEREKTYGVRNGVFGQIYADYSFEALRGGFGAEPLAYAEVAGTLFFTSSVQSGKVFTDNNTITWWGESPTEGVWHSPIVNPTATLQPIKGKLLGKPPLATALAYFNGRIYLAQGRTLWATELYLYDYIDKTKNFLQFEHDITCLGYVSDGLYVGTEKGIYFLSGSFDSMRRMRVSDSRALFGSLVQTSPDGLPNKQTASRGAILLMSDDGLCVGFDSGIFSSLTDDKVWFPKAESVAAMVRKQDGSNQYVAVADSAGAPASTARIGDYVDAEIRRFSGA